MERLYKITKSLLAEPLVQFLLLAAATLLIFKDEYQQPTESEADIVISELEAQQLVTDWARLWGRSPTASERDKIIENFLREEIFYREALDLGLDRDDPVIRRRLQQKYKYFIEKSDLAGAPDDATLKTYYKNQIDRYSSQPIYSFDQIFIDTTDLTLAKSHTNQIIAKLASGEDWESLGDRLSVPSTMENATEQRVSGTFGTNLTDNLPSLPLNEWVAKPIASGFGYHVLRVRAFTAREPLAFESVRDEVLDDWSYEKRIEDENAVFADLKTRYSVIVPTQ